MREFFIDGVNKTVNFLFDYENEIIRLIKNCDINNRFNPELKQWIVPVNKYSKQKISEIIRTYNFRQIPLPREDVEVVEFLIGEEEKSNLIKLCEEKKFTLAPRDYQLECLAFAKDKGSIINGDDIGLGKTLEAIMYAEVQESFPCLVIVPASVKIQWYKQWLKITDFRREVSFIKSRPLKKDPNNWSADVVIINYDIIGKKRGKGTTLNFSELGEIDWKMIIFDEAHFLKEKKSQRAGAAKLLTKGKDRIIQLLTGTATMSRPSELWNLLKILGKEKMIADDWYKFIYRYCGGYRGRHGWVTDGATNTLELNKKLRESCYIRREKRDVLKELPLAIKQIVELPITNSKEIYKATYDFISYVREYFGEEKAEKAMEAEHLVALGALRKLSIEGKLKAIEQYLSDWKTAGGKKLVIYGIHREPLIHLADKFKSKLIAGGVSSEQKDRIKEDWINNDELFLFANISSGGTGLDGLQRICSNMLIIELPWRPSDLEQVIGRLERSGQEEPPNINFMLSWDTIDKQMWEMLLDKEQVTEAVNKGVDVISQGSAMRDVVNRLLEEM